MKRKIFRAVVFALVVALFALPSSRAGASANAPLAWRLTFLPSAHDVGSYVSLQFSPTTRQPVIAYYDATQENLGVMMGLAENGRPNCGINMPWYCTGLGAPTNVIGKYASLAINSQGLYSISAQDIKTGSNAGILVYGYDRALGGIPLDEDPSPLTIHQSNSSAYDSHDVLWLSYYKETQVRTSVTGQLRVMHQVEQGTGNCGALSLYLCETIDTGSGVGAFTSLGLGHSGNGGADLALVAYRGPNGELKVASSGGAKPGSTCNPANANWDCATIDNSSASLGNYIALYQPTCTDCGEAAHIAYYDAVNHQLKYAEYVGSGGNCGLGSAAGAWSCTTIASLGNPSGDVGIATTLENGAPLIAYMDATDPTHSVLRLARYVDAGGNCGPDTTPRRWLCSTIDNGFRPGDAAPHSVGAYVSMALDPVTGRAAIAYYDATSGDLNYASLVDPVYLPVLFVK